MGGGGDHPLPKVPDWRTQTIDGIKPLQKHRDRLQKEGLKDPWIRNEVRRFKGLRLDWGGTGRVLVYALITASAITYIRNHFLPRDKHGKPYLI